MNYALDPQGLTENIGTFGMVWICKCKVHILMPVCSLICNTATHCRHQQRKRVLIKLNKEVYMTAQRGSYCTFLFLTVTMTSSENNMTETNFLHWGLSK